MATAEIRIKNFRRISDLKAKIEVVKNKDYSPEFIDKGYSYARNIAPQDTGAIKNALQKVYQKKKGRLRLVQPNNPKDAHRGQRPYHMWFHGIRTPSAGAKGYDLRNGKYRPKSGIPNFMNYTFDYMNKQTKSSMEKQMKQLFK